MTKTKSLYVCQQCGQQSVKWVGRCPGCDQWATMTEEVVERLAHLGLRERIFHGADRTMVATAGDCDDIDVSAFESLPAVELIVPTVSDEASSPPPPGGRREVCLGPAGAVVGGQRIAIIAGPCSVEDRIMLLETAHAVREAGAVGLRGGAFKPRTNPYSFQGLGERALELLAEAREATGLAIVTEVMSPDQVELVGRYADVLQVGTRNMHNFNLLSAVGRQSKPVLLKRGWSATLDEFLHAAEYIINEGNTEVIFCERGIRTFEDHVRNTLALAIVPMVKQRSPLPIIVDPSQGTGVADLIAPMSKAAIACGADGLLIEVHPQPAQALTDADQTIGIEAFVDLMSELEIVAHAVNRSMDKTRT